MIKPFTAHEVNNLDNELGEMFFQEANLPGKFSISLFRENWTNMIKSNMGVLFGCFKDDKLIGAIGGVLFNHVNTGDLTSSEMFWYVNREHRGSLIGIRLLDTFTKWSKEMGAKHMIMAHLVNSMPDKLESYYIKKGFNKIEVHYVKEL